MHVLGRHMGWSHLLGCGLAVLIVVIAVGFFGLGLMLWAIVAGAFCAVMMIPMIWMMIAMGKHADPRH